MLAFEIHINGKRRCLAGIANDGAMSAVLSWVGRGRAERGLPKEDVSLQVGGLDSLRREHMDWLQQSLAAGDEVMVRVVDVRNVDAPLKGSRRPVGDTKRHQKAYVRRMARQFGWKIQTK
jgi:bifunctional ADP-heptose synthase (sugar kinase/adenylyltransferase)